jgi:hypothetical protein
MATLYIAELSELAAAGHAGYDIQRDAPRALLSSRYIERCADDYRARSRASHHGIIARR